MRLLNIIPSLNPQMGGVAEGVRLLTDCWVTAGVDVEIIVLDSPDSAWENTVSVAVHALGPAQGGYGFTSRLIPWLKNNVSRFDAVIVHGLWQYHGYATWRVMRRSNIPYFVFPHGMLGLWFKENYPLKHLKKWLYWPWGQYPVLRDAKAVFFTCEEERVLASQSFWLYRCTEQVVGFGTHPPENRPLEQIQSFLDLFPKLAGQRCLLFLGRLHVKKGCDLLIRSFSAVADRYPDLLLVMAGPDQTGWRSELESLASDLRIAERIVWTGMLSGDKKWGALRVAEAFVLPSHHENFGVVVAESLACGTPVLISNQVNIWREIEEDKVGIAEDDTQEGTLRLLERWLELSTCEKQEMSERALKCFATRFDIRQASEKIISAIG